MSLDTRLRVSNDNAIAEALFRTAEPRAKFPSRGFLKLDQTRGWAARRVSLHNRDHRYSGQDHALLATP